MATFPSVLTTGRTWDYPLVRALEFETKIAAGENGTEQRYPIHAGRESWALSWVGISYAEKQEIAAAFLAAKGAYDSTISFDCEGETYTDVYFVSDEFEAVETSNKRWNVSVKLARVFRAGDTAALPADFPALGTGAPLQLPYTAGHLFDTTAVLTEGARYSRYNRGTTVRTWSAGGAVLTDAEALAIWNQFSRAAGRWKTFHFTDPDSSTEYTAVRFSDDRIEWRYVDHNINSVEVKLQTVP